MTAPSSDGQVPTASAADGARALAGVVLPVLAKGAIARRPRAVRGAERMGADVHAVAIMQRLRDRYGPGPVQVRLPGRRFTFLLEPDQAHRVLNASPEPFATATREKRGALGHFQPDGVLISSPAERAVRKPFNDAALQDQRPVHQHGQTMADAVQEEMDALLGHVELSGTLVWEDFVRAWMRMVRRIVLGDSARDDDAVTDDLVRLRKDGNWSVLKPTRRGHRDRLLRRLADYVDRAEPGSLAQMVASVPAPPGTEPHQQVPQWLFAFDAGTWATFRALALAATHPGAAHRARTELPQSPDLPFLRATVLESLRLWPTTPAILRDTTEATTWAGGSLPAGASVMLFAPFFHRDETRVPEAHRFAPELWLRERTDADWPFVPFSGGPAMCPGRNVVLLAASTALGRLLERHDYTLQEPRLSADRPLPGTLSPFHLRFTPRSLATH